MARKSRAWDTTCAWKFPALITAPDIRKDERIVGGAVGLGLQDPRAYAHDLPGSPVDLGHAPKRVGVLDPGVSVAMGSPGSPESLSRE